MKKKTKMYRIYFIKCQTPRVSLSIYCLCPYIWSTAWQHRIIILFMMHSYDLNLSTSASHHIRFNTFFSCPFEFEFFRKLNSASACWVISQFQQLTISTVISFDGRRSVVGCSCGCAVVLE